MKDKHRKLLQQKTKNTITKKQSKQKNKSCKDKIVRVKLDRSKNRKFEIKKSKCYDNEDDNVDDLNKNQELPIYNYHEKKIQRKIKRSDNVQTKEKKQEPLTEIVKKGKKRRIFEDDDHEMDLNINRQKPKIHNENENHLFSALSIQGTKRQLNDAVC